MRISDWSSDVCSSDLLQQELARRRNRNVFRMLMHSPEAAPGFLAMTDAARGRNALPAVLRELTIVRVGRRYGAPYEVHHHERIGREAGMSEEIGRAHV